MIELKKICHRFNDSWILNNISYTFEDKRYLLIGPSGIGKTTLLNIASSLIKPTFGSVISKNKIGYIFQNFNLLSDFTIKENIEIAIKLKNIKSDYETIVEITKIQNILNKFPNQISGGEKQRAAIARTLADGSNFIIADEPTSNLDEENSHNIKKLFDLINQKLNIGFLISTHDYTWKNHCDIYLQLYNGELII